MKRNHTLLFRLTLLTLLLLSGVVLLIACNNQATPAIKRVGVLAGLPGTEFLVDSLKAEMAALGYVEGENIEYDVQVLGFDMAAYQSTLQRFVDEGVDVIYVFPSEATFEAKAATEGTDVPVVFSIALVEGMGIIESVRQPGGNITGVQYPSSIAVSRYDVMRQLSPDAKRILIPHQQGYPIVPPQIAAIKQVADTEGITLIEMPVNNAAELESALQKLGEDGDVGVDAILLLAEPLFVSPDAFPILATFAEEHELPIGGAAFFTEGYRSMFGVDIDMSTVSANAASLIDKILQGVPAGSIPVISSDPYFSLDMAQIEDMGIEAPEPLVIRADFIYRGEPLLPPGGEMPPLEESPEAESGG